MKTTLSAKEKTEIDPEVKGLDQEIFNATARLVDKVVSNMLKDLIDKVVRDYSSELIFQRAKENIVGNESKKDKNYFNQKSAGYQTKLKETEKLAKSCEKRIYLYEKIRDNYLPLVAAFNEKCFKNQYINSSRKDKRNAQQKEWDEVTIDSLVKFFKEKFDEETTEKLQREEGEIWEKQNERVQKWMMNKLFKFYDFKDEEGKFSSLPNKEYEFSNIQQIEQKLQELDYTKSLLGQFIDKLSELEKISSEPNKEGEEEIRSKLNKIVEDIEFADFNNSKRIVWVSVGKDGEKSDFCYPAKTEKKRVDIPYHNIQRRLIEATTIISDTKIPEDGSKKTPPAHNYLTAHIAFIVSVDEHKKDDSGKNISSEGRDFIDFPIALPFNLQSQQRIFANQQAFEKFLESSNSMVGKIEKSKSSEGKGHSEQTLEETLKDGKNIQQIIEILKTKLIAKFGSAKKHKIYQVILFTNSIRNFCRAINESNGYIGCEERIWKLESSAESSSFLPKLTKGLKEQGFVISDKREFLPMLVANTSYEPCEYSPDDAKEWLNKETKSKTKDPRKSLSIDVKQLAGKVILSTPEWAIPEKESSQMSSVPFYSGFASGGGGEYPLKEKRKEITSETPRSEDKIDLIVVQNQPKIKNTSASQLSSGSKDEPDPKKQRTH